MRTRQHVLQHLVDHGNVRGAAARGVRQHAFGVETLIQNERIRVQQAAHHHLQAAHVVKRQRDLPQPLAVTIKRSIGNRRRVTQIFPGQRHSFRTPGGTGREHDHRRGAAVEHMRAALGEMDDAFKRVLARFVLATARSGPATATRAPERPRRARLGRGDVRARVKRRALRMPGARSFRGSGSVIRHGPNKVRHIAFINGVRHVERTAALQVKQARLLFRVRQPVVQRHQREPAVCRRQQQKHARWLVRQVHGNRVAKRNAATTQQASKTRRNHAGFPVRQRFDVAVFVDIREARALRIEPHHVFEHADHVGNAPAFALRANRSYGNFGNFEKSGLRFSLNASRPSFASSLV